MTHLSSTDLGSFRVVCISSSCRENAELSLKSRGFHIYTLEGKEIVDKHSLMGCIVQSLHIPMPENEPLTSWDAASDLVWQVLMERTENRIAMFWHDSDVFINSNLQLYIDSLQFFHEIAESVERQVDSNGTHPVLFRIVAFGRGENFPPWP